MTERCRDDLRRQQLAERGNRVERARSEVAERAERLGQMCEFVEACTDIQREFAGLDGTVEQRVHFPQMAVAQLLHHLQRGEQLARRGFVRQIQQHIRRAAERRHDDNRTTVDLADNYIDHTRNRRRVGDRRAAEFADDHDCTKPSS